MVSRLIYRAEAIANKTVQYLIGYEIQSFTISAPSTKRISDIGIETWPVKNGR